MYHSSRRHAIHLSILAAVLALTVFIPGIALAEVTPDEQAILSNISADRMMSTVERLCSDEFKGRRAGSMAHYAAADYVASQFAEAGLSEGGWQGFDGYKQPLTMRYALIRSKDEIKATLSYSASGTPKARTFAYSRYNGSGGLNLQSNLVFVGYGIDDPGSGHSDYTGLDVTGKIVLWLSGKPATVPANKASAAHKMIAAYQRGAAACLMYKSADVDDAWGTNVGLRGAIADFPCIAVDGSVTSELLGAKAQDLARLKPGRSGASVGLEITQVCDPHRPTNNIVGVLPGSDPEVAAEIVMIGAHYDHLGDTASGQIFRGADDNASGTSVVLETARAMMESGLSPRRTIVFCSWTGEECGLIGSNYFASNPPFALKQIVSSIQLDMVGTGTPGSFMTTGASTYPEHYSYLDKSGRDLGLSITADAVLGSSDHLAFTRKKVPTSLIYSAGEHPNFHTIRDTPDTLQPEVLESAARLATLAIWRAANS